MVGYKGRNAKETFIRSLMWERRELKRSQLDPELAKIFDGSHQLMMGSDLSEQPDIFGKQLTVRGLFIYKQSSHWLSQLFLQLHFDVILYNEIELTKINVPPEYIKVRMRDLQEFPYTAAVQVHVG